MNRKQALSLSKHVPIMPCVIGPIAGSGESLSDLYVQLEGQERPYSVLSIAGDHLGERRLTVAPSDAPGQVREADECHVMAAWRSPQPLKQPHVDLYSDLGLSVFSQEFADRHHGGYRYVVLANGALPHAAFHTVEQLASWAGERGLRLPGELPKKSFQPIAGQYAVARHATTLSFDGLGGVWTRAFENGAITAAQCVADRESGMVTMHVVGSNCLAREEFDRLLWPPADNPLLAFYVPGQTAIVDQIYQPPHRSTPMGRFSGQPLDELRQQHPAGRLMFHVEAVDRIHQAARLGVEEISAAEYENALGSMPPEDWHLGPTLQSFKWPERYCGDVTMIFAGVDDRFFKMRDLCTLKHEQIIQMVRDSGLLESPAIEADEPSSLGMR